MRYIRLLLMLACAAACAVCIKAANAYTCFPAGESYTFYCGDSSRDCGIVTVKRGAALAKLALCDVNGESTVYKELDIAAFLNEVNGEIAFTEKLCDSTNYYCTADLPYSAELYGRQISLHICVKEGSVTVASPIIFGGY